jgi:hypothetical protein
VPELHAYSEPPQLRASNRALTPITSRPAPSQSILCSRLWNGISRITRYATTIATIASGTLM